MPQILIIEDDVRLAGMLSDYLGQNGFVVTHAPDAQTGLARLPSAGIDLVILDLMLPDMDGLDLSRQIRAEGVHQYTPVIVVSGDADERLLREGFLKQHDMRLQPLPPQCSKPLRDLDEGTGAPPCHRPGQTMDVIGHDRQSPIERR